MNAAKCGQKIVVKIMELVCAHEIKWIIGFIDSYGSIRSHVVRHGDTVDSHNQVWPNKVAAHGKWRWRPSSPLHINTYGEDISDDDLEKIYDRIEKIRRK